jgi:hypothetical protein
MKESFDEKKYLLHNINVNENNYYININVNWNMTRS